VSTRTRVLLLLVLAAVPRFAWLATPPATFDETWSWYLMHLIEAADGKPLPVGFGLDGPWYVAINWVVTRLLGNEMGPLRLPPAVFSTLSVPLFYLLVRRLGSERLAWHAALLMAISPFFIFYAKDARPYSQLMFTCLLFTWGWVITEGTPRRWLRRGFIAVLTVLAVGSQYYSLIYFAAFYSQRLWLDWRRGQRAALRDDLLTGVISVVAISPLLALLYLSVTHLISLPYWQSPTLNFVSVVAEQFLFTGAAGAGEDPNVGVLLMLQAVVFALLMLPVIVRRRRKGAAPELHPILANLWWWSPALVQVHDILATRSLMFYPRGFTPSAPFLLTWWLTQRDAMPGPRWQRRAYTALMLVPFVAFGYQTAVCDPNHAGFKNREVLGEVMDQIRTLDGRFDRVVVHLWWDAQAVAHHYRGPAPVEALGMPHRTLARKDGEMAAVLTSLIQLPPTERLLLVENALASGYVDPGGLVRAALDGSRPRLAEVPCHPTRASEVGVYCNRMILYGPVGAPAPGAQER
jgi:hypothetical protein